MKRLAQVVEQQPGWQLELAFVGPRPAADVPADLHLGSDEQVDRLLSTAETFFADGETEAAALLAWSAVETILRRDARAVAPEIERQSSARVLKHLYAIGRIHPTTYEKLFDLLKFRNALGHGFAPRSAPPSIPDLVADIRRMRDAA